MFTRSRPDGNRERHCSLFCRWLSYTAPADERGCWNWIGAKISAGYGALRVDGKLVTAHRLALFFKLGRWPDKALHSCDNRACCNPEHLRDGTMADNVADTIQRKRHAWFRWSNEERRAWVTKIVSCQSR
jgi:hypothetical protein